MTSLREKLAKYSSYNEEGCLIWHGGRSSRGYGNVRDGNRQLQAHRASYLLNKGPIPAGMLVCHRCDVRACINPDHLFLGTNADNSADMKKKGRSPKTWQRLTNSECLAIAKDSRKGREIADEFGINLRHVFRIKSQFRGGAT